MFFRTKRLYLMVFHLLDKILSEGLATNVGKKVSVEKPSMLKVFYNPVGLVTYINPVVRLNREGRQVTLSQFSWNLRTLRNRAVNGRA